MTACDKDYERLMYFQVIRIKVVATSKETIGWLIKQQTEIIDIIAM